MLGTLVHARKYTVQFTEENKSVILMKTKRVMCMPNADYENWNMDTLDVDGTTAQVSAALSMPTLYSKSCYSVGGF